MQSGISLDDWHKAGGTYSHKGHDIFYRRAGEGPVLLLVHGFPTATWDFAQAWEALTARFDVIAPDMIGFGFSAKPRPYPYSVFDQADLMEGFLSYHGVDRLHIFAHDFGDTVVQEMLIRAQGDEAYPAIQSVSMMNGGLFYDQIRPILTQRLLRSPIGKIAQHFMNRRALGRAFRGIFGPKSQPSEGELDDFWRLITHNGGKAVMHDIIQYLEERRRYQARWTEALADTPVPLQFIYGPEDPISGTAIAERLHQVNDKAEIVRLDGIGHYPQVEAPDDVLHAFFAFHDRLKNADASS